VLIRNYGKIDTAYVPLDAVTYGDNSPVTFFNYGDVVAGEEGLDAETSGDGSSISITNYANVEAEGDGISAATSAYDQGNESPITIFNAGDISSGEVGIYASTGQNYESDNSPVTIYTSGNVEGGYHGIYAHTDGFQSPIYIENRGELIGGENEDGEQVGTCVISDEEPFDRAGICAAAEGDDSDITIVNYGSITAYSGLAIDTEGGATEIINEGLITGRVDLTEEDDAFDNAGTFEAREESDFGDGDDVFSNTGTVHALGETSLVNLEEFNSSGLISMVDGRPRDVFSIEGPVAFNAASGSRLAVDAKLGPPGSNADLLVIDGNVDGKTAVSVNNTNLAGGALNKEGIPVVEVTGSVGSKDFFLKGGPVDAGFFAYDLFFEPGDPNVFELRSALGGNAFVLPQLTTAMQDLWHTTSDTWFDRTADLRTALYGAPAAALQSTPLKLGPGYPAPSYQTVYPGLWARGSAGQLNRDASVSFTSFGPATVHLNRDQRVGDVQAGIDFGTREVLGTGDAVIFGVLGGFVVSELDYDQLAQSFDLKGGQVGAYVTYLNGGLFVDTLFKADFVDLDPKNTVGFAGSLDAQNFGVRVDSGYRFGGFGPGMFVEPLATIGVVDSEIDNFTQGGNRVSFDDGTSVRGRLGLRLGTNFKTAQMTVEPFVIGSVWHEFEDENRAALMSSGTLFNLADRFEDTWGEVSAGINLFNISGGTSGFGKIDVAFGDDVDGIGGQIGVRYKW
jgi:outer membrane autotransporter protein